MQLENGIADYQNKLKFDALAHFRGKMWDFNFVKNKVNDHLPSSRCEPIQRSFIFYGIATVATETDKAPMSHPVFWTLLTFALKKYPSIKSEYLNGDGFSSTSSNSILQKDLNNLIKCLNIVDIMEHHSVTIQFLWSFDYRSGKFILNEHAHFGFNTLKTKIFFHYNQHKRPISESEKFISDLYSISKSLSSRPKFQIILISVAYLGFWAIQYVIPIFKEQCEIKGYFSEEQVEGITEKNRKKHVLMDFFWKLMVHFEVADIFKTLIDIVPKAVEMELFILTNSCKNMGW